MTAVIERMAREAGLLPYQEKAPGIDGAVGDWAALARFAALVRAQALEDAARECLTRHANGNWQHDTRDDCAAAILALRECT
jgi:hypothetical protein